LPPEESKMPSEEVKKEHTPTVQREGNIAET
jgi:hypothetical protein